MRLLDDRVREGAVAIELPGDRADLLLGEVVGELAQRELLVAQREVDHRAAAPAALARSAASPSAARREHAAEARRRARAGEQRGERAELALEVEDAVEQRASAAAALAGGVIVCGLPRSVSVASRSSEPPLRPSERAGGERRHREGDREVEAADDVVVDAGVDVGRRAR